VNYAAMCMQLVVLGVILQPLHATARSKSDFAMAEALANAVPWLDGVSSHTTPHPLGQQTLTVEPHKPIKGDGDETLRVYQYHYDHGHARVIEVSLVSRTIVTQKMIYSVHLPLNSVEIDQALARLQSDENAIQQLRDEQIRRGQQPFKALSELSLKAIIYEPEQTTHACAKERCALLSLFDNNHTVFSNNSHTTDDFYATRCKRESVCTNLYRLWC